MIITYSSNNSGGSWWLTDQNWYDLEEAGWSISWKKDQETAQGKYEDGRWLGALATDASKNFPSMIEAITEWERITGLNASDEGCSCCGSPHYFYSEDGQGVSGDSILDVLYGINMSKRELLERLKE